MLTPAQYSLVEKLKKGARLDARFKARGGLGDFRLLNKRGVVIDIVPRATLSAVCRNGGKIDPPKPEPKPKFPACHCLRCGWKWIPRHLARPKVCAGCYAPDWDVSGRPPRYAPGQSPENQQIRRDLEKKKQQSASTPPPASEGDQTILDDIARGLAGKAFARLRPTEQETVRTIAQRVAVSGSS
jgi:hypothetical protein